MVIRGILENSLNGQLCIRGFAPIKELARISKADYNYQRNPIVDREDIINFLETEAYLFFPEIILSYKIRHDSNKNSVETPLKVVQYKNKYKSNKDNTEIKIKKVFNTTTDEGIKVVELVIEDKAIELKPFHRIDGNHRLLAAEKSTSSTVDRMVTPFCIILGEEFYNGNDIVENQDTKTFDKATKVFFHNINTKTIPLTSEENLKVIIDDRENFSEAEIQNILGEAGVKTRELLNRVNPDIFTGIGHIISKQYRTYFLEIFNILLNEERETQNLVNEVFEALKKVDVLYSETDALKNNSCFGLLTSFLYYRLKGIEQFEMFKKWVLQNHIFDIQEIKAQSIVKIFDKIAEQEIKIFVAMPYFDGNPEIVKEYNKIYSDVVESIKKETNVKISLYPIMQNEGATQDQIQDIINKIQNCEIFIADITDNNANVSYEMGWARALNKPTIIVREKTSQEPKSDYKNDAYHTYDNVCRSISLTKIAKENILEILNKNYGVVLN